MTYRNATIEYFHEYDPHYYIIKILIEDTTIEDNGYLTLDINFEDYHSRASCNYTTSIKTLICKISSSSGILKKFITEQISGSIKWNNPEISEDSVRVIIKQVSNLYDKDSADILIMVNGHFLPI